MAEGMNCSDYEAHIRGYAHALYDISQHFYKEFSIEFPEDDETANKVKNILIDILDKQRIDAIQKLGQYESWHMPLWID